MLPGYGRIKGTFTSLNKHNMNNNETDEIRALVNEKEKIVYFNKLSGQMVGIMSKECAEHLNTDYYTYKPITIDETKEKWVGNLEDGRVVNLDDAPVTVREEELDGACTAAIERLYPPYSQINALSAALRAVIAQTGASGPEIDHFLDIFDYIDEKRSQNNNYKKAYEEGPDWDYKSKAQSAAEYNAAMEGGLHEAEGPREHSPAWIPW